MALTVGIDLGTTYTVISYIDKETKKPIIIKNRYNNPTTPSVIGFNADGTYTIGEDAKNMEECGDINTASFYKLHMGDHSFKVSIFGKEYLAVDLSALFLKRLIEDAERAIGEKIVNAVITVPAYFEEAQKNDTLKAGEKAGLNVLNIISEPTAACVAYGLNENSKDKKILIYDLGGGTFDVTVAQISRNDIKVLGTNGHHQLGGRDWDNAVVQWLADEFYSQTGKDISLNAEIASTNMVKAEKAKKILSNATSTDITVDDGENKLKLKLTRELFENLTSYQLSITTDIIEETLEEIKLSWSDLDGAVLVGGSTKMPMVKNYIKSHDIPILEGVHPDEAVAIGAAIQANISNFCALLPEAKTKSSLLLASPEQVNLQLLPGAKLIQDVISHSLGMIMTDEKETKFVNDIMIKRNTSIDKACTTKRRELRVSKDKAKNKLDIYLLQGESDDPIDCTIAKKYSFNEIDYIDGGRTNIDITYSHTINGTIDVKAVQTETGRVLSCKEEPIPDDMSWVEKSPKEVFGETIESVTGTLVMALDVSGSMLTPENKNWDDLGKGLTKTVMDIAKSAMSNFADELIKKGIDIVVIAFADTEVMICNHTKDINIVNQAINALNCEKIDSSAPINGNAYVGVCNASNPLPLIVSCLDFGTKGDFMYGIILTDGEWSSRMSAENSKHLFTDKGYELVGMGFGEADINFLRRISTRSELAKLDDINNLSSNLSSIARIISE